MCGVIAAKGRVPPAMLKELFLQSSIRGRHATGAAWWLKGNLHTHIVAEPAEVFLRDIDVESWYDESGNVCVIGHTRYSTSNRLFNQPISNGTAAIVHNGVITQEPHSEWERLYGLKTDGQNDTELLFLTSPDRWPDSSIGCVWLSSGEITYYRNGKRPLWVSETPEWLVVASTEDILFRSGFGTRERVDNRSNGKDYQ